MALDDAWAEVRRSASFSRCARYRYSLSRQWTQGSGICVFIGLNPSIADEQADDPTIRRCMGFARDWGYQELTVVNLFAYRTPSPTVLKRCKDPVGPGNRRALRAACQSATMIVAAWGTQGEYLKQSHKLSRIWKRYELFCFSLTKNGHPVHPLYQRRDAHLVRYEF